LNLRHKSGLGIHPRLRTAHIKEMTVEKMHNENAGEYYLMNPEAIAQHPAHGVRINSEPRCFQHGGSLWADPARFPQGVNRRIPSFHDEKAVVDIETDSVGF
jgi:hypothetical protein